MIKNKRAFTLIEITITMAVMAIILVMVTSFVYMINNIAKDKNEVTATHEQLTKITNFTEAWISSLDTINFEIVENSGDTLTIKSVDGTEEYTLKHTYYPDMQLTAEYKDGDGKKKETLKLPNVRAITFSTNSDNNFKQLIRCDILYTNKYEQTVYLRKASGNIEEPTQP